MDRLLALVGDRRSVGGLLGAAAGLGLTFGGIVDSGWWAITAGLYAAGFLVGQLIPAPARVTPASLPIVELPDELRRIARNLGPQLPAAAQTHLSNILNAVTSIQPKLRSIDSASPSVVPVRQLLADYVPTTLAAYAALPERVRAKARLSDGRTAAQQVTAQLALLEKQMDEAADHLLRGDLIALEAQGRFLEEKFASTDFLKG